ncbi:MAG: hypothetical protein M3460_12535 [Actinomycetota bacterium]|nr:hypothetical protein [Actinomycetota bacterium]
MANTKHAGPFTTTGESSGRFYGSQPLLHQHGVEMQRFGTNELRVWFVAEHLVDVPAVRI